MGTEIIEHTKDKRSFIVEQFNNDYITVKKMKNNKEYEVEVFVFTRSDIEEYKILQEEIYRDKENNKNGLMELFSTILRKLKE